VERIGSLAWPRSFPRVAPLRPPAPATAAPAAGGLLTTGPGSGRVQARPRGPQSAASGRRSQATTPVSSVTGSLVVSLVVWWPRWRPRGGIVTRKGLGDPGFTRIEVELPGRRSTWGQSVSSGAEGGLVAANMAARTLRRGPPSRRPPRARSAARSLFPSPRHRHARHGRNFSGKRLRQWGSSVATGVRWAPRSRRGRGLTAGMVCRIAGLIRQPDSGLIEARIHRLRSRIDGDRTEERSIPGG
jgi:hypothetical protein